MSRYTHGHHESVLRSHLWRTVDNSAAYLAEHLEPGMSLLDVGCGPGNLTVDLARRLTPGRVIGVDNAESIIERARIDIPADVVNIEFRSGDVYEMEFGDDSFDIVHAHQVLQHLDDPVAALAEMRRACRPGGIVAARDAVYSTMTWHQEDDRLERWRTLYRAVAVGNGGEPDAGRFLLRWARLAGFREIESSASAWCFATPSDRRWWGTLWADRTTQSSFADQAIDRGLATRSELEDIAAAWIDWTGQPDGWFAVTHGEIIATVT
jgi:SAM-dependent methyltransferase